jgi:hypothetical protein
MTSSNDQIPIHRDFEDNKTTSLDVLETHRNALPQGMSIYVTNVGFGISYKHHEQAKAAHTGELISFNQSFREFTEKCNDSCDYFYKLAKKMIKIYGPKPSLRERYYEP